MTKEGLLIMEQWIQALKGVCVCVRLSSHVGKLRLTESLTLVECGRCSVGWSQF